MALAVLNGGPVIAAGPRQPTVLGLRAGVQIPVACDGRPIAIRVANQLLQNRYQLGSFPTVTLPSDLTWTEDPLRQDNWLVRFHGLSWMYSLTHAWTLTGDARYADRIRSLVDDWLGDNSRSDPASPWTWYDQATGRRATVLSCVRRVLGAWPALDAGLRTHGRLLADPDFYLGHGNHALDQAIGLLDVGAALGRDDWMLLARSRITRLVVPSVSRSGVTNEQAVYYQLYNYRRYTSAAARMAAYGLDVPAELDRVRLMPRFLAHATLPIGRYEMIGDTESKRAAPITGTIAEFAATLGATGPMPASTVALFDPEGWLFARTGWGTARPFRDEAMMTFRFGTGPRYHGHDDLGAVTLFGYGSRLVLDSGKYTYQPSSYRRWFQGRAAHNVVLVDGVSFAGSPARLQAYQATHRLVQAIVSTDARSGVTDRRRVLFSRELGYLVVEDRLTAATPRRYRQLWHLMEDARPLVTDGRIVTRRDRGNVLIMNLDGGTTRVVTGSTDPIQGWVSYRYGEKFAAPVVQVVKEGWTARFLTLLVPGAETAEATVGELSITDVGFAFTVTIGRRAERVVVDGTSASIVDAPPAVDTP